MYALRGELRSNLTAYEAPLVARERRLAAAPALWARVKVV